MIANDASSNKPIACVGFGHVDRCHHGADRIIGILSPNIWTIVNLLQRLHRLIPLVCISWGQGITSYASCCRSILYSWKRGSQWTSPTTSSAILVIGSRNSNSWLVMLPVVVGTPTTEAHVVGRLLAAQPLHRLCGLILLKCWPVSPSANWNILSRVTNHQTDNT